MAQWQNTQFKVKGLNPEEDCHLVGCHSRGELARPLAARNVLHLDRAEAEVEKLKFLESILQNFVRL